MDGSIALTWVIKILITLFLGNAVRILAKLERSIEELNVKMAVVIEQIGGHERRITKIETFNDKKKGD